METLLGTKAAVIKQPKIVKTKKKNAKKNKK